MPAEGVSPSAGTHMWTAPCLQEVWRWCIGSLAIICPVCCRGRTWPLPRWFPRREFQTGQRFRMPLGTAEYLASWDRSITPTAPSRASFRPSRQV